MTVHIPDSKRAVRRHTIVVVKFQQTADQGKPMSEAPILCSCSEVVTSGTWDRHRGVLSNQESGARGGKTRVAA